MFLSILTSYEGLNKMSKSDDLCAGLLALTLSDSKQVLLAQNKTMTFSYFSPSQGQSEM